MRARSRRFCRLRVAAVLVYGAARFFSPMMTVCFMSTLRSSALLVAACFVSPAFADSPVVSTPECIDAPVLYVQAADPVQLLDAGAEPRRELRYNLAAMQGGAIVMDMDMDMTMSNPMMPATAQILPRMSMQMSLQNVQVMTGDRLRYDFTLNQTQILPRTGADPALIPVLETAMATMGAMSGYAVIDSRGSTIETDMVSTTTDPAMAAQLQSIEDSMKNMTAPFPLAAVGPGARWSVPMEVSNAGFTISQTATYELVSLTGDAVILNMTISQSAQAQRIESPDVPPGMAMYIDSYSGVGTGTMTIQLSSLVPTSTMTLDSDTAMSVDDGAGNRVPVMAMEMRLGMSIHP